MDSIRVKSIILSILLICLRTNFIHAQQNYVRVEGTHFTLDGRQYYFVGTNFWYGCYIGSTGATGDTSRLVRELNRMEDAGINNLRILGASELSNAAMSLKPAIQISPGIYDDSLLAGLDFLLSEMGKRNMHAVIFLNNYWTWSGGMYQYNSWFGGSANQYDTSPFYRNAIANDTFKTYISFLINRQNTITGLHYYEDPTIMAWELANEPRPGSGSTNSFYQWIDSTAKYIHSLDPNHLVTTGNEGTMGCNSSGSIFLTAHQNQYIDYATIHVWALNWGWIDTAKMAQTYPGALSSAESYVQQHISYARMLGKPLVMEEFGLPRDGGKYSPGSTTTFRDEYDAALLQTIYDSACAGAPIAGSNFWGWGGEGRSPNSDYVWRVGDPFVCDPPMEAQGLNSVFDTDSSTIKVILEYADSMSRLRTLVAVKERGDIARGFKLYQNYPNPFNPTTAISYQLPDISHVTLEIYDVLGREVRTLVNEVEKAGRYDVMFDADNLSSGVYFCKLVVTSNEERRFMAVDKLLLFK
ncbi:MAG TPA: T9SS type A sorting domain-containing protein [Candidatus Acidoferrales bacterium]|nr:T9SS type A sorting domain-containing protein [Candidatus Acidoferrales bacterium]